MTLIQLSSVKKLGKNNHAKNQALRNQLTRCQAKLALPRETIASQRLYRLIAAFMRVKCAWMMCGLAGTATTSKTLPFLVSQA